MSLKQYNPHLQLTIHRARQFFLGLRLLSALIISLVIMSGDNYLLLFILSICVLILHIVTERRLFFSGQKISIGEYAVVLSSSEFELSELRILFGCIVLISLQQGRKPILMSRDQLSTQDWQNLVRYSKLK